jgi:hypothetical protein
VTLLSTTSTVNQAGTNPDATDRLAKVMAHLLPDEQTALEVALHPDITHSVTTSVELTEDYALRRGGKKRDRRRKPYTPEEGARREAASSALDCAHSNMFRQITLLTRISDLRRELAELKAGGKS